MLAPSLIEIRIKKVPGFTSGQYKNTVQLYEIWADRIRMEELNLQAQKTEKERGTLKKETIKPIGVG